MRELIRKDFPNLERTFDGKPLVYLDNAATSQRPKKVIDATIRYYTQMNANVHRGVYQLSQEATDAFEAVRGKAARWIGAPSEREVIFTKGTTESMNLIASTFGEANIKEGDVIAVTRMEHHANFVPWQQLAKRKKAKFEIIELTTDWRLDSKEIDRVLALQPKILAITMMSNVTGVSNPVSSIASRFKLVGTTIVVDAAQGIAHGEVTLDRLGPVDFLSFSAHKVCGPTGVGILWGREALLEKMPPYQLGGNMISHVGDFDSEWNELPHKFEAGTPHIAGGICLGEAIRFLSSQDLDAIQKHEKYLADYAQDMLDTFEGVRIIGEAKEKTSVVSFVADKIHPFDIGTLLDKQGVAVRTGHHCTQPLMDFFKIPGTVRASFAFYNTKEEVDVFIAAVEKSISILK